MHQLQRSWVRSQHPSAQWNLRGGRWSSAEYCTNKKKREKNVGPKNRFFWDLANFSIGKTVFCPNFFEFKFYLNRYLFRYSKWSPFPGLLSTGISLIEVLTIPWAPPFDRYFANRSAHHSLGSSFREVFRSSKCSPFSGLLLSTGISLFEVFAILWAPPFDRYFTTVPNEKCSPFPGLLFSTSISLLEVLAIPWASPFDRYFATRSSGCHSLGSSFRQVFRNSKCSPFSVLLFSTGTSAFFCKR